MAMNLKKILLEESKEQLKKANERLSGAKSVEETEKAILVKNTWLKMVNRIELDNKENTRGLSENDKLRIAIIAKDINNVFRKHFQQEKSEMAVSAKAIENCLIHDFNPVASWKRWKKARTEAGWKEGPYNQKEKKTP